MKKSRQELEYDRKRFYQWYILYSKYMDIWRDVMQKKIDDGTISQKQFEAIYDEVLKSMSQVDVKEISEIEPE